jgi:heme oxygenase (biliverdin-producing, ferredoxin)
MPLVVAAAASAVAPPPSRRLAPLTSIRTPRTRSLALTVARCSPSPSVPAAAEAPAPPQEAKPKPRRYPKQYPGEAVGVAEEMRFVAMRLRNPKRTTIKDEPGAEDADAGAGTEASDASDDDDDDGGVKEEHEKEEEGELQEGEWMPSMEGFVRYLVDSKLVFDTIERVVAESTDVACESQSFFLVLCC